MYIIVDYGQIQNSRINQKYSKSEQMKFENHLEQMLKMKIEFERYIRWFGGEQGIPFFIRRNTASKKTLKCRSWIKELRTCLMQWIWKLYSFDGWKEVERTWVKPQRTESSCQLLHLSLSNGGYQNCDKSLNSKTMRIKGLSVSRKRRSLRTIRSPNNTIWDPPFLQNLVNETQSFGAHDTCHAWSHRISYV